MLNTGGVGDGFMNSGVLLRKLIELERAIGVESESTIRHRVLDAEDCLLNLQRAQIDYYRAGSSYELPQRFTMLRRFAGTAGDDIA